jgi:hypothetical protein
MKFATDSRESSSRYKYVGTLVYQVFILIICASITGDRMLLGAVESVMTSRIIDDIDLI